MIDWSALRTQLSSNLDSLVAIAASKDEAALKEAYLDSQIAFLQSMVSMMTTTAPATLTVATTGTATAQTGTAVGTVTGTVS